MKQSLRFMLWGLAAWLGVRSLPGAAAEVLAAMKPDGPWKSYPTRLFSDLSGDCVGADSGLSKYGGLHSHKVKATGFFYCTKVGDRWWLVDPEGCLFLHKGVASVNMMKTPGAQRACAERFGGEAKWAGRTADMLLKHGFNGAGAWSDTERLRTATHPLVYTKIWNFMSSYGKERGGTFSQPGHTGYPHDCIFVFDPAFESFCDRHARQLSETKNDPWLLGHFSDNEMPLNRNALTNFLQLPQTEPGHAAAWKWFRERHGEKAALADITEQDQADFLALVVERYFKIVSAAIKNHDPNHLFLGSRFHGAVPRLPEVFRAAGPYVDVVSVNLYHVWTPDHDRLAMWERESGRPFLITEWYAKGMDSGMKNTTGAGWVVKTQADRGKFYQNFTLALLASKACVGWHWFKYMDNDPYARNVDPSNVDSNKGIFNNRYEPYVPLLQAMKEINDRSYSLVECFDHRPGFNAPARPSGRPAPGSP